MSPDEKEHTITQIEKVIYTAKAHTTGGRDGGASAPPMAALTLSCRFLVLPAPAPTPSSCSPSVGRLASFGDEDCGCQKKSQATG